MVLAVRSARTRAPACLPPLTDLHTPPPPCLAACTQLSKQEAKQLDSQSRQLENLLGHLHNGIKSLEEKEPVSEQEVSWGRTRGRNHL